MDEFIRGRSVNAAAAVGLEAKELVNHPPCCVLGHPNIAVHDPDDVALCLAVCAADVADFGVGA